MARAARRAQHTDAADFTRIPHRQQPGGADGLPINLRQKVNGDGVQIIDFILLRHALFFDKHRAAQSAAGGNIGCFGDKQGHAK